MTPEPEDPLDGALVALAHPDGVHEADRVLAAFGSPLESAFLAEVARHRLEAPLVDALVSAGQPVPPLLERIVADDRLTRLRVGAVLARIAPRLDASGIEWLTFKGPMISSLMSRPELRTFNDLDLLVGPDRFADAVDLLVTAGAEELNHNWLPYIRHRVGEVPMDMQGATVDLHWHLIGLYHHRRAFRLPVSAMLSRRRHRRIGDRELPGFDAEDQLLQLALHAAMSGATRLDQLRDLAVVAAADPVDWPRFECRARDARVGVLVAHALDRAGRVLGAPVDNDVVDRLGGRLVSVRRRLDGTRVRGLRAFTVVAGRDSVPATVVATSRRLRDITAGALGRGRGWDFTDERGRLFASRASGGPSARATFLRSLPDWA